MNNKEKLKSLILDNEPGPIKFKDNFFIYVPYGNSLTKPTTRKRKNYICSKILTIVKFLDNRVNISFVDVNDTKSIPMIVKGTTEELAFNDNLNWRYGTVSLDEIENLTISDDPMDFVH